jgi:hypothetical protein
MTELLLETDAAAEWLYERLSDDAELTALLGGAGDPRVFEGLAPPDAAEPFLVFHLETALEDTRALGSGGRVLSRADWVLRAVGEGLSTVPLRPIAGRADELLTGHRSASPSIEGLTGWVEAVRLRPVRYVTTEAGRQFRHLGAVYRLTVHTHA